MLSKKFRLPGSRLPRVLAGNTIFSDSGLVIKTLPNQLGFSRAAVVISSKFLPLAVKRNRLRRQLYALIDPAKINPGFDVVILVRKPHGH